MDIGLELMDTPHLFVQAVNEHRGQLRLRRPKRHRQLLEQSSVPLGQHDAELIQQPAQLVGLHDAHLHQLNAQSMQRQHHLLSLRLHRHEPHARLLDRRPDRPRVSRIGLVALNERTDHLGRQQLDIVAELEQLAAPLVSATASLHRDQCRLPVGEPCQHLIALELQPLDAAGVGLDPMQLEHLLGDVDRNDIKATLIKVCVPG